MGYRDLWALKSDLNEDQHTKEVRVASTSKTGLTLP